MTKPVFPRLPRFQSRLSFSAANTGWQRPFAKIDKDMDRLLACGRTVPALATLCNHKELLELEDEYEEELDRASTDTYWRASPVLSRTKRLDLVATAILVRDRKVRRDATHAAGLVFHHDNDYLSAWQYKNRLKFELMFESLDFISTRTAAQQITLEPGGWLRDRTLRVPQDSHPHEYDGVERSYGQMVGVLWSPPVGTK